MSEAAAPAADPGATIRSKNYRVLLVMAAVIGVLVSFASWCFLELVHWIQQEVYKTLPSGLGLHPVPWWWPLPVLAVAGVLTAVAIVRLPGRGATSRMREDEGWDVLEDIPNGSAAALILLEHHWAVPLRNAVARAGGFRISDGFISPLDLVALGLVSAEEARELHELETASAAGSTP